MDLISVFLKFLEVLQLEESVVFLGMILSESFIWIILFFFLDLRLFKLKLDHPKKYIGRRIILLERQNGNVWDSLLTTKYGISTWDNWDAVVVRNNHLAKTKQKAIVVDKEDLVLIVDLVD